MNSVLSLIEKKRLVKNFKPDPIPDTILNGLVDAVAEAVSYGNLQPWRVVLITEEEKKQALAKLVLDSWLEAPITFIFMTSVDSCKKTFSQVITTAEAVGAWAPERVAFVKEKLQPENPKLREVMTKDVMIAATQLAVMAEDFGLGSCFFYEWDESAVKKMIGANADQTVVAILNVGYVAELLKNPGRLSRRQLFFQNDLHTPYQFRPHDLRSPREMGMGLFHLPRLIDKVRLAEKNYLPGYNFISIGFDKILLDLLGVQPEEFIQTVKTTSTDEAVYQWLKEKAKPVSEMNKEAFNQKLLSVGPSDPARLERFRYLLDATDASRKDVKNFMELIDLMEGRI